MNSSLLERPLSDEELVEIVDQIVMIGKEVKRLSQISGETPEKLSLLKSATVTSGQFYELSYLEHSKLIETPELKEKSKGVEEAENRPLAARDLYETPPPSWFTNDPDNIQAADALVYLSTLIMNFRAIEIYGVPINFMIQFVKDGHEKALKAMADAVRIDPSSVSCPTIASRLQLARITGDDVVPTAILNALRSPKIKPPDQNGVLRFILLLLHEMGRLESMSEKERDKLICLKLKLYPNTGSDPKRSLSQFIRRWKMYPLHDSYKLRSFQSN